MKDAGHIGTVKKTTFKKFSFIRVKLPKNSHAKQLQIGTVFFLKKCITNFNLNKITDVIMLQIMIPNEFYLRDS